MTRFLDTVYFGRIDRSAFFFAASALLSSFSILLIWLIVTAHGVNAHGALGGLWRAGGLLDLPSVLLAHGVSDHRVAGIVTLCGLYLITGVFVLAARARDIGLWGWPTALVSLAVLALAGRADPWVASLSWLLIAFFLLWPSRPQKG